MNRNRRCNEKLTETIIITEDCRTDSSEKDQYELDKSENYTKQL